MSERPSLMEQAGISDSQPGPAKAGRGGGGGNTVKIVGAVVLVVAAAAVVAWSTGLLGGGGPPKVDPKVAQERQERLEKEIKEEKALDEQAGIRPVESGG